MPDVQPAIRATRMGRPSLEVRKTTVRLPVAVFERIAALVGENRMATFIREAVLAELERRETLIASKPRKPQGPTGSTET